MHKLGGNETCRCVRSALTDSEESTVRKAVLATITASALALTACGGATEESSRGHDSDQPVVGPAANVAELSEELDELLLEGVEASNWDDATEGWASDVTGTEVNGATLLAYTTLDVNDGGAVDNAELIGGEILQLIDGDPATEQIARVTVSYSDGRGAYTEQL